MGKSEDKSSNEEKGFLLITQDGTQYYIMGKVRIKVSEHFAEKGKPIDALLEDVIQHMAAAS